MLKQPCLGLWMAFRKRDRFRGTGWLNDDFRIFTQAINRRIHDFDARIVAVRVAANDASGCRTIVGSNSLNEDCWRTQAVVVRPDFVVAIRPLQLAADGTTDAESKKCDRSQTQGSHVAHWFDERERPQPEARFEFDRCNDCNDRNDSPTSMQTSSESSVTPALSYPASSSTWQTAQSFPTHKHRLNNQRTQQPSTVGEANQCRLSLCERTPFRGSERRHCKAASLCSATLLGHLLTSSDWSSRILRLRSVADAR